MAYGYLSLWAADETFIAELFLLDALLYYPTFKELIGDCDLKLSYCLFDVIGVVYLELPWSILKSAGVYVFELFEVDFWII